MLTKLRLQNFKSYKDAELTLGPLTILVGTNASGKSNIRDAMRFIHGVSRGYPIADILGERYVEGGFLQWRGIRGGPSEITFHDTSSFTLEVSFLYDQNGQEKVGEYSIQIDPGFQNRDPSVLLEKIGSAAIGWRESEPSSSREGYNSFPFDPDPVEVGDFWPILQSIRNHPFTIKQLTDRDQDFIALAGGCLEVTKAIRFLDLDLDAMRRPSRKGQVILGDRGENLSSVLEKICENPSRKQALLSWISLLTPMDVQDLEFARDLTGNILLTLVERDGRKISAFSASDGTLRFLAFIAALLEDRPAKVYFFEEIENGIHPTRLHLLMELIEQRVYNGGPQVIVSTHSPQLLRFVSPKTLGFTSMTYRLPDQPDTRIKRILDIPDAKRVIDDENLARIHESGWLEDAVYFTEGDDL